MAFKDLREFSAGKFLDLPIDGKTYRVHDVDAETGLWVQGLMDAGIAAAEGRDVDAAALGDDDEQDVYGRVLGATLDELVEGGVGWSDIKHAGVTAMLWIAFDTDTAQAYWESGGVPGEAPAPTAGPNRASRRASAASARKTRSRASTTPTKAPRSTSATKPAARGKKS